jgi:hypothetical protein
MSTDTEVSALDLVPGATYRVTFNDCCVSGWFVGVFRQLTWDGEPDPTDRSGWHSAEFDTGGVGQGWANITFEEER